MADRRDDKPVQGLRVRSLPFSDKTPGKYTVTYDQHGGVIGILYNCPCGCGAKHGAMFPGSGVKTTWTFNGNIEKPTLTPSLGLMPKNFDGQPGGAKDGSQYHWHGYLTDGVFVPC